MAMTCAYVEGGRWRRSLLHVWDHHVYSKRCVRCGTKRAKVF